MESLNGKQIRDLHTLYEDIYKEEETVVLTHDDYLDIILEDMVDHYCSTKLSGIINEEEVFELKEDLFSENWFKKGKKVVDFAKRMAKTKVGQTLIGKTKAGVATRTAVAVTDNPVGNEIKNQLKTVPDTAAYHIKKSGHNRRGDEAGLPAEYVTTDSSGNKVLVPFGNKAK